MVRVLITGEPYDGDPHPILTMYLGCAHWSTPAQRVLPWKGGWLDWDLEEAKQYIWLEEVFEEEKYAQERREKAQAETAEFLARLRG